MLDIAVRSAGRAVSKENLKENLKGSSTEDWLALVIVPALQAALAS